MIAFHALVVKEKEASGSAAGVYLPEGRRPIIPPFHHSNCERSELSSYFPGQGCQDTSIDLVAAGKGFYLKIHTISF
jgi:hypothetical protein